MMADPNTDTLRKLAPSWSLAGDERLLTILQNTHQRLVTKCHEANSQLEKMTAALDDASISLQNVNNQFMALSSRQFIERRVYDDDDDADVATEPAAVKELPKLSPPDELAMVKRSLAVIDSTHEVITILHDSDTESDTDDEMTDRLVMKPKDVYADRPLPYIIGSEPWKSKWHAGLMPEDSDTDSDTTSKVVRESDQYSQSEPEDFDLETRSQGQDIPSAQQARKLSETSSEVPSEITPNAKPTPSDVASEIARRLGGGDLPPKMVAQQPDCEEPPCKPPAARKVYKPQEPVASTIFPDEPPPLEDDADIFAELHRGQPYARQAAPQGLFGGGDQDSDEGGDIFNDFANQPPFAKPTSLFEAGPTPHMFDRQRNVEEPPPKTEKVDRHIEQPAGNTADADSVRGVKKPVGGISLFGSNTGTENIGAAILQRNRRKSNSSESGNESQSHTSPIKDQQAKKEKDIFNNLFTKADTKKPPPKANTVVKEHIEKSTKQEQETFKKDIPKPVDLFSDNLFDDFDDIFTTNVVKSSKDKQKSIFEDDDELFSEVASTKAAQDTPKKGGLFDSDDDLFSENISRQKPNISTKPQPAVKISTSPSKSKELPKQVIDTSTKVNEKPVIGTDPANITKATASIFDDEGDDIFSNIKNKNETVVQNVTSTVLIPQAGDAKKNLFNSPSLFGEDDDESDLFTEFIKPPKARPDNKLTSKLAHESSSIQSKNNENKFAKTIHIAKKEDIEIPNTESEKAGNKSEIYVPADENKVLTEAPSATDYKITEILPSSSVTTDFTKEKDDLFKASTCDHNVLSRPTNVAMNTTESKSSNFVLREEDDVESKVYETPTKTSIANVPTSDLNVNTKSTTIQKHLDGIHTSSRTNLNDQQSNVESASETAPVEISKNITSDIKSNDLDINVNIASVETPVVRTEIPATDDATIGDDIAKIPKSDIFTDIISEPPDFEKPKEPKKSKNVNALFDDDSDDESLFFKRDDIITDEKPEDFTIKPDKLFDIFTNEPPDEDFAQDDDLFSTLPKSRIPRENIATISIDDIYEYDVPIMDDIPFADDKIKVEIRPESQKEAFLEITKTEIKKSVKQLSSIFDDTDSTVTQPESLISNFSKKQLSDDEELFKSLPVHLSKSETEPISKKSEAVYKSDEELFKPLPPNLKKVTTPEESNKPIVEQEHFKVQQNKSESSDSNSKSEIVEVKKVNKLKVGLNINVNALLPGASPKKVKAVDIIDGQTQSQVEIQDQEIQDQENVPPLTKPVSFDGEVESKVLDNKLSKERPRIQVKRRPSSRRARREAVRKSGIDFGEDSTDNSSSIDDHPKSQTEIIDNSDNVSSSEHVSSEDTNRNIEDKCQEREDIQPKNTDTEDSNLRNEDFLNTSNQTDINTAESVNIEQQQSEKHPVKSDSTTKIVYILNDEDIFNTSVIEDPLAETEVSTKISTDNISNNSGVVTSNITDSLNSDLNSEPIIKTLGNTYKTINKGDDKQSKSLFGETEHSDDEELFRGKKPTTKTAIFDSDSEGELFGKTKKVETEKNDEKVIKVVKGSLFGDDDDDDDDDLFAVKTSKPSEPQQSSKSTASVKEVPKATQQVFADPLSMFGDDE